MFLACKKLIAFSYFLLASLAVFFCSSVWAEQIIIGGTGNALGTMQLLANAYQARNSDINITVLPSIGSSGAIKAVPRGKIDIGLSSRRFKKAEFSAEASVIEYARSPTVIAVSNNLDVTNISIDQLSDIYNGKQTVWPNGDLIRPIIRQDKDDNTIQLKQLSPELENAINFAENRSGLLFASTDQETVEKIEKTPSSFGVTTLALILSEKRSIHSLTLNGVKPTKENCINGKYPIIKQFYFILPKNTPIYVADFIDFVNSPIGQNILETNGNYIPE